MGKSGSTTMQMNSFNNTGFHHPQMGDLGPHPRHSWATDGSRVDGHDIPFRTANSGLPAPYAGASYVREASGAPVQTVWSWGHPSSHSSSYHLNSLHRAPSKPKQYEPMEHPHAVPAHMRDLNYLTTPHHMHAQGGHPGYFHGAQGAPGLCPQRF